MSLVAVVTGAGSGVGRAVALRLAQDGWRVALLGRRRDPLEETERLAEGEGAGGGKAFVCDISQPSALDAVAAQVQREMGPVSLLVNAAGINIKDRALSVLKQEEFQSVLATNLNGALHAVLAFLPGMRERKGGTIINIISDAGLLASAKAGGAYVASKFALRGLTQSINAEERANGIRATAILPGDINTPLLDKRPVPPPPEARQYMLQPEDLVECVMLAVRLPARAIIEELLIRPR